MQKFAVDYMLPSGLQGQEEVDAYDNIAAADKVKQMHPGCKVLKVTVIG